MFGEWDPALADALLQRMTPDYARIDVQSASWEHIRADIGKVHMPITPLGLQLCFSDLPG